MLLLTESQVQPCTVLRQNIFEEVVLAGVEFQGKLFFRVAQYAIGRVANARQDALTRFSDSNEQFAILLVQAKDHLTLWQEDPELRHCSARRAKVQRIKQLDLAKMNQRLHESGELEIRDRHLNLRRQKNCFVAKELTAWLEKSYKLTVNDSIRLAQRMVDEKVIYHLKHDDVFAANSDLYRFYDD